MDRQRNRFHGLDVAFGFVVGWILVVSATWMRTFGDGPSGRQGPPMQHGGPPHWVMEAGWWHPLPFALVVAGGVVVRRFLPRTSFLIVVAGSIGYLAVGGPIPAVLPGVALCVYALAVSQPVRRWLPLTAVLLVMVLGASWNQPALGLTTPTFYAALAFTLTVTTAAALLGLLRTSRLEVRRRRHDEDLQRVAHAERIRVAREVHDVVGHSLSVISLQAGVALHVLDRRPDQAVASLEAIRTSSGEALTELRHTLGLFRDDGETQPLAPAPGLARIGDLAASLRAAGRDVQVRVDLAEGVRIPASVQQAAFRIVQEALTNVIRHAEGASANVQVIGTAARLSLTVTDDGPVLAGPPVEGNGLRGMRERLAAVDGSLQIEQQPTGGLTVIATLPLHRESTE